MSLRTIRRRAGVLATAFAATLGPPLGAPPAAQTACERSFDDSVSRAMIAGLERVTAAAPVWDRYQPAAYPVLLVSDSSVPPSRPGATCAAIWRAGRALEHLELSSTPRMSTPFYGMIDVSGDTAHGAGQPLQVPPLPPDVARTLRARGVSRAVVLPVPLRFERLGALGDALRRSNADPVLIQAELAVHEGFHLHVQHPHWSGRGGTHAWPAWDRQPDRRQVRERCYAGSDSVAALLQREVDALGRALDALRDTTRTPDTALAARHVTDFVALRMQRYALLDSVRVDQGAQRISCAEAEDVMELEEGAVQWIGHATTVRAGMSTLATRRASYARVQPDAFYVTAPLQMWILDRLIGPDRMRELGAAMARSSQPGGDDGGIFGRLQHQFRAVEREAPLSPPTPAHVAHERMLHAIIADARRRAAFPAGGMVGLVTAREH